MARLHSIRLRFTQENPSYPFRGKEIVLEEVRTLFPKERAFIDVFIAGRYCGDFEGALRRSWWDRLKIALLGPKHDPFMLKTAAHLLSIRWDGDEMVLPNGLRFAGHGLRPVEVAGDEPEAGPSP